MAVNEDIADAVTSQRLDLLRFERGIVARVTEALESALTDLRADLRAAERALQRGDLSAATVARLRAHEAALRQTFSNLLATVEAELTQAVDAAIRVERATLLATLNDLTPDGLTFGAPALEDLFAAVSTEWRGRIAVALRDLHDDTQRALAAAVARGASVERFADTLATLDSQAGRTRNQLVTTARTELQSVSNVAAVATYQANADVLAGVEYLATLDSRTCLQCAPLHGETWPMDDQGRSDAPIPPLHPRCRCFLVPVTKGWAALGLAPDSDLDGQPSGTESYDTWFARQPESRQAQILGPARYDAYRAGLALADMRDDRGPLTVEQLRAAHPDAFT